MESTFRGAFLLAINNVMSEFDNYQDKSVLEGPDPEHNEKQYRQDGGGLVTADNGIADRLLKNDRLYREMKGDWTREGFNKSRNIKTTTGRQDGKFYIKREQFNTEYIAEQCAEYRKRAEAGYMDPLAPIMPDGKLGFKWIELPEIIAKQIGEDYFGGMSWHTIKRDRTLKAQFYRVVETEYPAFVCYPGGKLPIPLEVPYPAKVGTEKFFKGANYSAAK